MITIQLLMMGFPTPPGMTHVGQKNNTSFHIPSRHHDIQRLDSIPDIKIWCLGRYMFFWGGVSLISQKNPCNEKSNEIEDRNASLTRRLAMGWTDP